VLLLRGPAARRGRGGGALRRPGAGQAQAGPPVCLFCSLLRPTQAIGDDAELRRHSLKPQAAEMQAPPPRAVVNVHPLSCYSFGHAPARTDKGGSLAERQARSRERYGAEGALRTVEGIILVNEHNHPHVLLLQARACGAACAGAARCLGGR